MKNKKVYVLSGSEDGVCGVYSNKKELYNGIIRYMEYCEDKSFKLTYSQLCKTLKEGLYYYSQTNDINVSVDFYYMNQH